MLKARHYIVIGRVQGVGFRWFVLKRARDLGLTGWVRNLSNGNVELWAEGRPENLELLGEELKQGPSSAHVRDLKIEDVASSGRFPDFNVTY